MLHLIELDQFPILKQLQIEEALLRTSNKNWCLINRGTSPAIILGISQDPNLVINCHAHQKLPIPLIRRYSGGGTVVVEPTTIFVTLILNHDLIPVPPFPKDVLKWTNSLYQTLPFTLKENDYAIGDKKCGGNAQYFAKNRLVHHTSFLFDFSDEHMNLLQMPPKMPSYRESRSHQDFLIPLKTHFTSPKSFSDAILNSIRLIFPLVPAPLTEAELHTSIPHRKSTYLL